MGSISNTWAQKYEVVEPLSTNQFVRADFGNGKFEIGIVSAVNDKTATISTNNGYDVSVERKVVKKAFLVILDLNGVLVAKKGKRCAHRPYLNEFLEFLFKNFVVGVWTSGMERTCAAIIDDVIGKYKNRLLFTFYREKCEPAPTADKKYGTKKNLQRIFNMFSGSFHSANTIIIDDSPEKCSHPDLTICPVPFKHPSAQQGDEGLKEVINILQEVLAQNSHFPLIRAAEKRISYLSEEKNLFDSQIVHSSLSGHSSTEKRN